jgi:galactokinase
MLASSESEYQVFVPGRVCLFGEHSDWAGGDERKNNPSVSLGRTIVVGTNQGLHASCKHHPTSFVVTSKDETGKIHGPFSIPMSPAALLNAARDPNDFFRYACGVAYHMLINYRVGGLEINNHATDLPLSKGLSSSAALCVLVARAFSRVYGLKLTTRGEMDCAYVGERLTPSKCGRMDQACAFGSRPVLMDYDADFLAVSPISIPRPLHLLVVDLCADPPKDTTTILAGLQSCYRNTDTPTENDMRVRNALGSINLEITNKAVAAMEQGDAQQLGALMTEAQKIFDAAGIPVCPEQLTAPLLHTILHDERLQHLVYGGKGVGSQGDGCAQFVCKSYEAQQELVRIVQEQMHMVAIPLTIQAATTVRRAVIPAAGFSASLFPSTKVVTPPLFPVVDRDGVAKPAILIVIDELCRAGFDRIVVVVQEADQSHYQRLFKEPLSPSNYHRLTSEQQQTAKRIMEVGERVDIVVQTTQQGFSHAIYCAKDFLGDERFMVVLGDHIYRSTLNASSCVQQMVDASKQLCSDGASLLVCCSLIIIIFDTFLQYSNPLKFS